MTGFKHGRSRGDPTYRSWWSMKARCRYPSHASYARYGGRGITFDPRWEKFENFLEDMGERPDGMTLDRLDPTANYVKGNCRWATPKEQGKNRSNNVFVEHAGQRMLIGDWEAHLGYKVGTLRRRLARYGNNPAEIFKPVRQRNR